MKRVIALVLAVGCAPSPPEVDGGVGVAGGSAVGGSSAGGSSSGGASGGGSSGGGSSGGGSIGGGSSGGGSSGGGSTGGGSTGGGSSGGGSSGGGSPDGGRCQWAASDAGVSTACAGLPGAPAAVGPATALSILPGGMLKIANLTYAHRGGFDLQGDLVVPPHDGGSPGILVVVHGGGWEACDRRRVTPDVELYAASMAAVYRIATFNVEYRLRQEGGAYPENLKDVRCALAWISANASTYGLDGTRLAIAGESAGAHLALMSALAQSRADLDPGCGAIPPLQLVLSYSGPTDLPALTSTFLDATVQQYAGPCVVGPTSCQAATPACTRCDDASPVARACAGGRAQFALIHAPQGFDGLLSDSQARALQGAFVDAGVASTLMIPTDAELVDAGCGPAGSGQAHGWNKSCLQRATGTALVVPITNAIGVR